MVLLEKSFNDDSAPLSGAASKRSAMSASDAECFSLCLGAGPLWYATRGPDVPAQDSVPPGGVRGGAASPATPSTPLHDDNNCDLLSALLCNASLSSSVETLPPPRDTNAEHRDLIISKIQERKERGPVKIEFKIYLTENTASRWEAVIQGSTLYLRVPGVLSAGSKDGFVALMDFAEDKLACADIIICVRKSRPDRAVLLRTFMFMGFTILPPNSPTLPQELANPEYLFLHYNMQ